VVDQTAGCNGPVSVIVTIYAWKKGCVFFIVIRQFMLVRYWYLLQHDFVVRKHHLILLRADLPSTLVYVLNRNPDHYGVRMAQSDKRKNEVLLSNDSVPTEFRIFSVGHNATTSSLLVHL
jgi:hypothetical protein